MSFLQYTCFPPLPIQRIPSSYLVWPVVMGAVSCGTESQNWRFLYNILEVFVQSFGGFCTIFWRFLYNLLEVFVNLL